MLEITWADVPVLIDVLVEKSAAPAWDLRRATGGIFTAGDVGYYYCPLSDQIGFHRRGGSERDVERLQKVAVEALGSKLVATEPLTDADIRDRFLVKVGYSKTLQTAGENLNFFPGTSFGLPNAPSPLAALLTTALIGGGLGYAGGHLAKAIMPEGIGKKLPRSGALAGLSAGSLLAAPWVASNFQQGLSPLDGSTLAEREGQPRSVDPASISGDKEEPESTFDYLDRTDPLRFKSIGKPVFKKAMQDIQLTEPFKKYLTKLASMFGGFVNKQAPTFSDVHVNSLGQTLWEAGASDKLRTAALGTMYAASQVPDSSAKPGWVTGQQLGTLAVNAAGDYATGLAVGAVLNATVGTPWRAPVFGTGIAALGLIRATLPKLFG